LFVDASLARLALVASVATALARLAIRFAIRFITTALARLATIAVHTIAGRLKCISTLARLALIALTIAAVASLAGLAPTRKTWVLFNEVITLINTELS
jgi:hypothetical protein